MAWHPECFQPQELLSYAFPQYNSEISNIHQGDGLETMRRGRMVRKNTLFLMHPVLMRRSVPGQSRPKRQRYCLTLSLLLIFPWAQGKNRSMLPCIETKQLIWLEALKNVWDTVVKCPPHWHVPAPPQVAKWTLSTRYNFLPSWASTPLGIA